MDRLDKMFDMQNDLDERIAAKYDLIYPQHIISDGSPEAETWKQEVTNDWLMQMYVCIDSEAGELRDELQWKHWKTYEKPLDREKIKKELIDIVFFALSGLIKIEATPEEIFDAYAEKYEENIARQEGRSKEGKNYGR